MSPVCRQGATVGRWWQGVGGTGETVVGQFEAGRVPTQSWTRVLLRGVNGGAQLLREGSWGPGQDLAGSWEM